MVCSMNDLPGGANWDGSVCNFDWGNKTSSYLDVNETAAVGCYCKKLNYLAVLRTEKHKVVD